MERDLVHAGDAEIVLGRDLVDPLAEQGDVVLRERAVGQVARERIFNMFGPLVMETAIATCWRFRLVARLRARIGVCEISLLYVWESDLRNGCGGRDSNP